MTKIFDYVLLACAIVAGAALFAFGTRKIYMRAKSPRMTRFLIYVSIVLVFLGGKLGTFKTISAETKDPQAVEQVIYRPLERPQDRMQQWKAFVALWKHIHELKPQDLTKEKFAAELELANSVAGGLDALVEQKLLTTQARDFLKSEVNEELQKVNPEIAGKEIPRAEIIKSAWSQITENAAVTSPQPYPLSWELKLLYEDTMEQFQRLKDIPLSERLATLGITRDEYKARVATLMANLRAFYDQVNKYETIRIEQAPIGNPDGLPQAEPQPPAQPQPAPPPPQTRYTVQPRPQSKYGVSDREQYDPGTEQPMYGVRPRPEPAFPPLLKWLPTPEFTEMRAVFERNLHMTIAEDLDDVMIKRVGSQNWVPLKKGDSIAITDIIDHEKDGEARIILNDTRFTALKGGFVYTTWEYDFQVPEALAKEIDELITKLGDPDEKVRDAVTGMLKELAYLAAPRLKEELNSPDAEVRRRAQEIIDSLLPQPVEVAPSEQPAP
jgi:hypothetical protein